MSTPGPGVATDVPAFRPTPHLEHLCAEVAGLAATVRASQPTADVRRANRDRAVVATLQLDGSPITAVPDHLDMVVEAVAGSVPAPREGRSASWYESFELLDDTPDEQVLALEAAGVVAGLEAEDLAAGLLDDPLGALAELHRRVTRGLLAPERAGTARTTEQAVHDASIGRILYYTVHPQTITAELERLGSWLAEAAAELDPVVASGLLHLELLRIHPFEAANGRVSRLAARLWLRHHGLDPHGSAAAEPVLATDRLGYHEEVARTLRRRDAAMWLERWAEAVATGLRGAARAERVLEGEPSAATLGFVAERPAGSAFTVAELRDETGVTTAAARAELGQLLDAGHVERVLGSRGLRFVVT